MNYLDNLDSLTMNNLNEICRTCTTQSNLQQLYDNIEIISMLEACTQLQFNKTEELLPDKICSQCILNLKQSFEFINTCKKLDESFKKCLNTNKIDIIENKIKIEYDNFVETEQIETPFFEHFIKEELDDNLTSEEIHKEKKVIINVNSDSENEVELTRTFPTISGNNDSESFSYLPDRSKLQYENAYNLFNEWRLKKKAKKISEDVVLAYFEEKSKKVKPSTLWSTYSMLKPTIHIKANIDIRKYPKLIPYLKKKSVGYHAKKSKTLKPDEINRFMTEANDENYLLIKNVLIMGICGACRRDELAKMCVDDIQDLGSVLIVKVPGLKRYTERSFTVTDSDYINFYRKYIALRPIKVTTRRFFLKYNDGTCYNQAVGLNKMGTMPNLIAKYLKLPNADAFTGHCFRKTSAMLLALAGGDMRSLTRNGGWKSSTVPDTSKK